MHTSLMAFGIFALFNLVAVASVIFSHYKKWSIDLTQYRHYTTLVFNVCGVIYALFMGFIIWDVWDRFESVKKNVYDEVKYLTDLYHDSTVFPASGEESIQGRIKAYISFVAESEWVRMNRTDAIEEGNRLVNQIWEAFYGYTPSNQYEWTWYTVGIDKLSDFSNARLTRLFNAKSSVGTLRWSLLILGGLILVSIPCFFRVEYFTFKLVLTLFLANIVAFMLFITYSLDHPFSGYRRIDPYPFQYALDVIKPW